jgi:hypothetical protein
MTLRPLVLGSAIFAITALGACSSGSGGNYAGISDGGTSQNPSTDEEESTSDAGSARDGAKKPSSSSSGDGDLAIVSLTPTVDTITGGDTKSTESNSVTFIAIVTDAAGLDTIAGGQLMDDSGATYAAFGAGANKGTYSATLTWGQLNSIRAAEFDAQGGSRTFVAKFFDNAKNEATAETEIKLACRRGNALANACGGACVDPKTDSDHCGKCNNSCGANMCISGICTTGPQFTPDPANTDILQTQCIAPSNFASNTTCEKLCSSANEGPCTRIMVFGASDATCAGTSVDGSCTEDLSKVTGPLRCRCNKP